MAKYDTDDVGKPGKPPKSRRFPWRLWLYALAMTAGAGAGGYYTWQYRKKANDEHTMAEAGQRAFDACVRLNKLVTGPAPAAPAAPAAAGSTTETGSSAGSDAAKEIADKTKEIVDAVAACSTNVDKLQARADEAVKHTATVDGLLDANNKMLDANKKKAADQEIELTALSSNLNASREELTALQAQRAEAEKRVEAINDIQKRFAKMIDTGQLKVTARRGTLVLSLPSEVLFPSGVAELSKPGELAVLEVGITLKKFPDRRFLVVGHTDDQPLKSSTYKDNWELSTARALTVTRFLVQAGMTPKNLVAAGAGENDPVSPDRAKNRRIEIVLLPAINELPPMPASLGDDTAKPAPTAEKPPAPAPAPAKN